MTEYSLRPAIVADLPRLQDIERAAGIAFADIGMEAVAEDEPPPIETLAEYQRDGRCWVSTRASDDAVIAYLIVEEVDHCCHIEQVSVHPEAARNGIGKRLLDVAADWAVSQDLNALTLTTFVDVKWNGPYYERCGFRFLRPEEETEGLRLIRAREAANGMDRWPRACMRRELVIG